jgi:phosphate transport system protein
MRKTFHEVLAEISEDVITMGSLVQQAVHKSIDSLINLDKELANKVVSDDERIDDLDISIEERCLVLQAEHQPVAKDLRFLHGVSIIIIHLERIGDLAVNIAKVTKRLAKQDKKYFDKEIIDLIQEMGNLVKSELNKALISFKDRDPKTAAKIERADSSVDDIQKMIFRKLFLSKTGKEEYIRFIANISLATRYLERIGDQSVNVAERVRYFLTGNLNVYDIES